VLDEQQTDGTLLNYAAVANRQVEGPRAVIARSEGSSLMCLLKMLVCYSLPAVVSVGFIRNIN
jgi:hypothetical protein